MKLDQSKKPFDTRRRLNVRILLGMIAGGAVLGGLVHLLHAVQLGRNADALKERAAQLSRDGELLPALQRYKQYVRLRPNDIDSWAELGRLLDETAKTPRQLLSAYHANEKVLAGDPNRDVVRRRNAEIAMLLGDFNGAIDHWSLLLQSTPDDGELEYQIALCRERLNQPQEAVSWYNRAVDHGYAAPPVFLRMARLTRGALKQPADADGLIEHMMKLNANSAEAYRTRAVYRRLFDTSLDNALADAREAARLDPGNLESLLLTAELTLVKPETAAGELDPLRESLEQRLAGASPAANLYELLSRIYLRQQQTELAVKILRRGRREYPENTHLSWQLADVLIAQGQVDEARAELVRLHTNPAFEIPALYLEARILMAEGEFVEARQALERVESHVDRESALFKFACLHLGACHGRMGQPDEQLKACRRALEVDPRSVEAQLGAAEALAALDQTDAAARIYRSYRNVPGVPLRLAQLSFNRQRRLPEEKRNWRDVEEALQQAGTAAPDSVEVALLRSEVMRAQGKTDVAQSLVDSLREQDPEDVRSWTAAVAVALRNDDADGAAEILQQAEQRFGDHFALRLARAALWSRVANAAAETKLRGLEEGLEKLSAGDRVRLLEGLAMVHFLRGDSPSAGRLWKVVSQQYPDHVPAQFRLLRLAVATGDDQEIVRRLAELRRIEGAESSHVLVGEALKLIAQARRGEAVAASQPRTLLLRAANLRPEWPIVPLALAEVAELEGNGAAALANYRRAIELDNLDPAVLRRTVELMLAQGAANEAGQLIGRLQQEAPASVQTQLRQLQVEFALAQRATEEARRLLATAVGEDSPSVRDQLWLGRMLVLTEQAERAERHFRRAAELAPQNPDAWVGLVTYLAQVGKTPEATAAVGQAKKNLSGPVASAALARCCEAVGDRQQAEEYYRKASEEQEHPIAAVRDRVEFYVRTSQPAKAEELLQPLLDRRTELQPVDVQWARRTLALLKTRLDYQQFQQALGLLDVNISESQDAPLDRRLKARLLAGRSHPSHLRDARWILQPLADRGQLLPEDRLLLASVCERLGDREAAAAHWQALLAAAGNQPDYVAGYIRWLLRQRKAQEAASWLDRLDKLQPRSLQALALRARWLMQQQQSDRALEVIRTALDDREGQSDGDWAARLAAVARMIEELAQLAGDDESQRKLLDEAEALHREHAALQPGNQLTLALYLARRGRRGEALDLCDRAAATVPQTQVNAAAVVIVRHQAASPDEVSRVDERLQRAVTEEESSLAAAVQLAEFLLSHERYEESIAHYQSILKRSGNHVVAMNNLAWLLSVWKQDHPEARRLIERAISQAGPLPPLLDTRGTISLGEGKFDDAVNDFRDAVTQDDSPAGRFHLALAYWKGRIVEAARFNFDKAREAGLSADDLYPLERADYDVLQSQFPVARPAETTND